jgi:hypothetical protein
MAALCGQFGYPASGEAVARCLQAARSDIHATPVVQRKDHQAQAGHPTLDPLEQGGDGLGVGQGL